MGIDNTSELESALMSTLFEEVCKKSEGKKIADVALELLLKLTGSQCGFILMRDAPDGKLSVIAERTDNSDSRIINDIVVETVLGEAKEVIIDDIPAYNRLNKRFYSDDGAINSAVCVPVVTSQGVTGALYLASPEKKSYTAKQIQALKHIGMQIGLVFENIYLHNIMQRTERINSVGQMAINLSHGIKNILQAVGGAAEVVDYSLEHNMPDKAISGWKILKCNLAKIRKLTLDMLEFSKDSKLILNSCDFNKLVVSVIEPLRAQAKEKKVSLNLQTDVKIPSVYLDGDKIQDVVMNLVLNAIEAVSPQTGVVTVETKYVGNEDPAITLTVGDNGPGIKAEDKGAIFQPFHSSKAKVGTGLGLPIVQKIVYQHGGKVEVGNNTGGGAVFKITLPARTQKPVSNC